MEVKLSGKQFNYVSDLRHSIDLHDTSMKQMNRKRGYPFMPEKKENRTIVVSCDELEKVSRILCDSTMMMEGIVFCLAMLWQALEENAKQMNENEQKEGFQGFVWLSMEALRTCSSRLEEAGDTLDVAQWSSNL